MTLNWKTAIAAGGATARAYEDYARERIATHTKVCLSIAADERAIRAAQAAIQELQLMLSLPEKLRMETKVADQSGVDVKRGY